MEAGKQDVYQIQGLQPFPIKPYGLGVGHPVFQLQPQKTHETQAVPHLIFDAVIGQIVQLLQYQELEHQHDIERLGPGLALPFLLMHPIEVWPKPFPVDDGIQPHQGIAHLGQLGRAFVYVKKSGSALEGHRVCSVGGRMGAIIPQKPLGRASR